MPVASRVARGCALLPVLVLRAVAIVIASAVVLEVARLVLATMIGRRFDRNTEYLVWTSVAIGALAEQKLKELIDCSDLNDRVLNTRIVRWARTGVWCSLGRVLQVVQIQNVLRTFEVDANGATPWNTSWTITVFHDAQRALGDWSRAVANAADSMWSLVTAKCVRITYAVPQDRFTGAPDVEHGTLTISAFRRTVLDGFMHWCTHVDAYNDPLLNTEEASLSSLDFDAIRRSAQPLPYEAPEDSWSRRADSMHVSMADHHDAV
jgi:hypothetical protein